MPRIEPTNTDVRQLQGLHLYHAGWSNCSMRVRMVLEEKGLPWTSHHLDTRKGEHITPEYFGIHPKGLVPALVQDGEVWIESNDIIRHLDEVFPEPKLTPRDEAGRRQLETWMDLTSAIHVAGAKTYIYCVARGRKHGGSPQESTAYRELQKDKELLEFHERATSEGGLTEADRGTAEAVLHDAFEQLDTYLETHEWLAGDEFSLADISWIPMHYTLDRVGFPFDNYPRLAAWVQAIRSRPSYQNAVEAWFNGPEGQ